MAVPKTKINFTSPGNIAAGTVVAFFLVISLVVYFVFTNNAQRFMYDEYEQAANSVTGVFSDRMGMLDSDFKNLTLLLYSGVSIDNKAALRDFSFYKVFTRRGDGRWNINEYWSVDKARASVFDEQYVDHFLSGFDQSGIRQFQFKSFVVSVENIEEPVFILSSFSNEDGQDKLVLAEPRFSSLFSEGWLKNITHLASLTLYHGQAAKPVWITKSDETSKYSKIFTFKQAGQEWRLKAGLKDSEEFSFVQAIPLYAFLGCMVFGCIIAFCVWDIVNRGVSVRKGKKELTDKQKEVEHIKSEQKYLREMLEKSELENRAVIDAVSDIIFEADTDGKIIFLNAAWRKVTGFDPEQFIGHDLISMLHPQEQKYQRDDFRLLVKGQKQAYRSFTRLRTSNGNFRAVEIAVSMMRQDKDRNMRVVGTFTDVEERRRAERALGEAEKKYRAIVENAAGGIYQVTPEGIYLSANPAMARILGYDSPEQILREVKNANVSVYVNQKSRAQFLKLTEGNSEYRNYETQVYCRDKKQIWVNENVRAVRDDSGNVLYYEGSIEDITKRKESEIALKEAKIHSDMANRAKSEFLANMSHELRTPLNAIIGFSEMIQGQVLGSIEQESYIEYAGDINKSGRSLLNIINEILDISKIEAGNRQLNEEIVDLEKVVFSVLDLLSTKIENNKMHVMNTLHMTPKVVGETVAIKQVLMNILSNAIKFTPSNGRITISSEVDHHGELRLSITDTGIGLDPEELKKALSPFGQVDSEMNREGSGTGLGLTLVDSLMKLHQGRMDVLSQKGIGTTVTLVFPVERVKLLKDPSDDIKPSAVPAIEAAAAKVAEGDPHENYDVFADDDISADDQSTES